MQNVTIAMQDLSWASSLKSAGFVVTPKPIEILRYIKIYLFIKRLKKYMDAFKGIILLKQ